MTWVSDPNLVAAVSNSGGLGCLAGGNTPVDILENQIRDTRELTDKPFAVNLITIAPLYRQHLELAKKLKLPFVIFAGGFPNKSEIQTIKDTGATVLCFASTDSIAKRMIGFGAEGIILEGMEAGGHVGHVSLVILLQQVLFEVKDVPIFVAGGLATGKICAHLLLMGAAGVQLGTRFAVAEESIAHPKFKEKFIRANARDAVSTPQFDSRLPVVAVRALRNKGIDEFGRLQLDLIKQLDQGTVRRQDAQMKVEEFWMGALRRAVIDGDILSGSLMAGQSVGLVNKIQPVKEIIDELVTEIEEELQRVKAELG
ncbi:nitronate monooxygenase [candidate division KSB1 bacterium]|nr:nitronate monooxygenase [candidate division KSB1 bacterium]